MTDFQRVLAIVARDTRIAELRHRRDVLRDAIAAHKGARGIAELRNRLAVVTRELMRAEHG